jgi:hypothetical protein
MSVTSRRRQLCRALEKNCHTEQRVRIPMKSAMHSNLKPATDSDLKPAGIPI